ncbi:hypothetical protein [Kitasatospora sp. NPDC088134]|uniref:hypothetical protein n=1 Tax=Kitasatospora sp. NPDC088134 TaxID=3364071 RepID=UPI00380FB06C
MRWIVDAVLLGWWWPLAVSVAVVAAEHRHRDAAPDRGREYAGMAKAVLALSAPAFWLLATGRRDDMAGQLIMAVVVALLGYGGAGSVLDYFVRGRRRP